MDVNVFYGTEDAIKKTAHAYLGLNYADLDKLLHGSNKRDNVKYLYINTVHMIQGLLEDFNNKDK